MKLDAAHDVMYYHNNLRDSPLQEAECTGLNTINLSCKVTPGKKPNLARIFSSFVGRSASILISGERLTHFFSKNASI